MAARPGWRSDGTRWCTVGGGTATEAGGAARAARHGAGAAESVGAEVCRGGAGETGVHRGESGGISRMGSGAAAPPRAAGDDARVPGCARELHAGVRRCRSGRGVEGAVRILSVRGGGHRRRQRRGAPEAQGASGHQVGERRPAGTPGLGRGVGPPADDGREGGRGATRCARGRGRPDPQAPRAADGRRGGVQGPLGIQRNSNGRRSEMTQGQRAGSDPVTAYAEATVIQGICGCPAHPECDADLGADVQPGIGRNPHVVVHPVEHESLADLAWPQGSAVQEVSIIAAGELRPGFARPRGSPFSWRGSASKRVRRRRG